MADNLPGRRIDREALDRIIKRAAELQAQELDTGEAMTESELLKLGADVGIDGRHLRQALYEQGSGSSPESGMLVRWFGPHKVSAGRVIAGEKADIEAQIAHWMTEGEALMVKRRLPDRTVWEKQKGFMAEMKRGFGMGGKSYHLARALDVTVVVTQLEPGFCHVEMVADVSKKRGETIGGVAAGSGMLAVTGGALFALLPGAVIFPFTLIALVPFAAAAAAPIIAGRAVREKSSHTQIGLEQVLDRLEAGEIKGRHRDSGAPFLKIADHIRGAIMDGIEQSKRLKP